MSTVLRHLGWWTSNQLSREAQRVALTTDDGRTFVVMADSNNSNAFAANNQYGDGTNTDRIYVLEISADWSTITERAAINAGGLHTPYNILAADFFEDKSLGIAYLRSDGTVQFRKVTVGTWAISAAETIATFGDSGSVKQLDLSISQGDAVLVSLLQGSASSPKLLLRNYVRNTAGVWSAAPTFTVLGTSNPNFGMATLSCQWTRSGTATARPFAIVVGAAVQGGADNGHRILTGTANESTGVATEMTGRETYLAGDMSTGLGYGSRENYLFADGGDQLVLAIMQGADKKTMQVVGIRWSGTAYSVDVPPQTSRAMHGRISGPYRFAATYAKSAVNFYYIADFRGQPTTPVNFVARLNRTAKTVQFTSLFRWDNSENQSHDRFYPMGGSGKFAYTAGATHGMVLFGQYPNSGLWYMRGHRPEPALQPTSLTPSNGSEAPSALPPLTLRARLGKKFPQSRHKAIWQFATNASFTTNVKTYTQPDSKFVAIENTEAANSFYPFSDVLPQAYKLTSGTWYVRGAVVDEFGVQSPWTAANSFTLYHPPAAADLLPDNGEVLVSGNVEFGWRFTDPSAGDTQSAYQIVVEVNETGQVIYDSGKVTDTDSSHVAAIDPAYSGDLLRWMVRLWDADDIVGEYSEYKFFTVAASPTVVIDSPVNAGTATSATPEIIFTPTAGGFQHIAKYSVVIRDSAGEVYEMSDDVSVDVPSGTTLQWRPSKMQEKDEQYSATVEVVDNLGLPSSPEISIYTVDYIAPASTTSITASDVDYNTDGLAYVEIVWDDNRDPNFEYWILQRRVAELSFGNVVSVGPWETLDEITVGVGGSAIYWDFYAQSGTQLEYRVRQLVNDNGSKTISNNEPTAIVRPQAHGYFIIVPADEASNFQTYKLDNVTEDSFTDEYEETSYNIIGGGRHVDRGEYLGPTGSLTCQIRSTPTKSARQKRMEIMAAKDADRVVHLRNPFGDVWSIAVGNIGVGRIAGVGVEEFVDLTVPYSQVAEQVTE